MTPLGIRKFSTWDLPPTPQQCIAIARLCIILKDRHPWEELVSTRREARELIYRLRSEVKARK